MPPIPLLPPLAEDLVRSLPLGAEVRINGVVYAARDAAHARMAQALDKGEPLPFDPRGAILYYVGPTPGAPGQVFGAAGPTSSYRMDPYAERLFALGLRATIGKGERSPEIWQAQKRHGAVYLAATGGAGALLAKCIVSQEIIAYEDLGPEALRKLQVKDFPAIIAADASGNSLYRKP